MEQNSGSKFILKHHIIHARMLNFILHVYNQELQTWKKLANQQAMKPDFINKTYFDFSTKMGNNGRRRLLMVGTKFWLEIYPKKSNHCCRDALKVTIAWAVYLFVISMIGIFKTCENSLTSKQWNQILWTKHILIFLA